ncbi:hypothetical protein OFN62_38455, partial [Escherichia coli]|nr:hypothetical protein [Escherichia coli]
MERGVLFRLSRCIRQLTFFTPSLMNYPGTDYDVVVMGGAFSGSSAAMVLKREHPEMRILIVERTVEFDRKVGESTSE